MVDPDVIVLICAHNESNTIPALLESLRRQTVGTSTFRTVLVDNASTDGTAEVARSCAGDLQLTIVPEPAKGKNRAVMAGYAAMASAYVAHIDADAIAHPDWLRIIREIIQTRAPDLFGGPYCPWYDGAKPYWFEDRYNSHGFGNEARALGPGEYLSGTNMVWRRAVIERIGGFSESVGLHGRGLVRGDETEVQLRARQNMTDLSAYYDPRLIVHHFTRPEWYSLSYWLRRHYMNGRYSRHLWGQEPGRGRWRSAARLLRSGGSVARTLLSVPSRDRSSYPYWQNVVMDQTGPAIYELGMLSADIWPPTESSA